MPYLRALYGEDDYLRFEEATTWIPFPSQTR